MNIHSQIHTTMLSIECVCVCTRATDRVDFIFSFHSVVDDFFCVFSFVWWIVKLKANILGSEYCSRIKSNSCVFFIFIFISLWQSRWFYRGFLRTILCRGTFLVRMLFHFKVFLYCLYYILSDKSDFKAKTKCWPNGLTH